MRDEVEHLRRELGQQHRANEISSVMAALDVPAIKARLLLRLYANPNGATMTDSLMHELSTYDPVTVRSHVYQLRKQFGQDAIVNYKPIGYALSTDLRARIGEAIDGYTTSQSSAPDRTAPSPSPASAPPRSGRRPAPVSPGQ
jgi:DNA-binding winged helix-turn-helix (wHTH) protein